MRLKPRLRAGDVTLKPSEEHDTGSTNLRSPRAQRRQRILIGFAVFTAVLIIIGTVGSRFESHSTSYIQPVDESVLHFHGVSTSREEESALRAVLYNLKPDAKCILHIHVQRSIRDIPKKAGFCDIDYPRAPAGAAWAQLGLSTPGRHILISGSILEDNDLNWLAEAWRATRKYEADGGVHNIAAFIIPSSDGSPSAVVPYRDARGYSLWDDFTAWFLSHRSEWRVWPHIADEYVSMPQFRRSRSNKHRDPALTRVGQLVGRGYGNAGYEWKLWFERWAAKYNTRAIQRTGSEDKPELGDAWHTDDESTGAYQDVLKSIVDAKSKTGHVSMTIVDEAFLEITENWLCNVRTAGFMPSGIVWLTLSSSVSSALKKTGVGTTVDITSALLGSSEEKLPEILYGHKTYWKLMLLRTRLLSDLVARGVEVFLFETDQAWLRNPLEYMDREAGADMVGTLDTQHNVAGNTLLLRSTAATRRLWREVYERFLSSYKSVGVDALDENETSFVQHDQHTLSDLLLYNEEFRREHPVALALMNANLFVGGSWYMGFYTSELSERPVIINNNFISGVSKKKKRAIQFGHWFLDNENRCIVDAVQKALQYDFPNGPPKPGMTD